MPKKTEYQAAFFKYNNNDLARIFRDVDERLNELEDKVLRTARKSNTTLRQQVLLLHHLGLLEKLNELKISGVKKARLLSVLLNGSYDNIYDHLSQVHKKDSYLRTKENYELLIKVFGEAGLTEHEKSADKILIQILKDLEK